MTTDEPTSLADLSTPCLLVERGRLHDNVDTVAGDLLGAGLTLRPHVKTSKCLEVAALQRDSGAIGFTCSTPAEVELLGGAGFGGLLWAHLPVGAPKVDFAVAAAARFDLTVALDSVEAGRPLAAAAAAAGVVVPFLLEVDTGQHRDGVDPDRAEATAATLGGLAGLRMDGVMTHEGHLAVHGSHRAGLETAGAAAGGLLAEVAGALRTAGHECAVVSVGSTPGLTSSPYAPGVTEARPGTYVYFDANQVRLGSASLDRCALTVLTRVVSRQRDGIAITDSGIKAMSSDTITPENGVGLVCDLEMRPVPDVVFSNANEEHGFLTGPGVSALEVGDLVRVVPNHACGTANMWSGLHLVDEGLVVDRWRIRARH